MESLCKKDDFEDLYRDGIRLMIKHTKMYKIAAKVENIDKDVEDLVEELLDNMFGD